MLVVGFVVVDMFLFLIVIEVWYVVVVVVLEGMYYGFFVGVVIMFV